MNIKELNELHAAGYVILAASRSTNRPIGWKHKDGTWGYTAEMEDIELRVYKKTFSAKTLATSHNGFYLGHNQLCCIDLDTKKTTIEVTTKLKDAIVKKFKNKVVVETTKSNGYHIYFRYEQHPNQPNFTGKDNDNWIELYYSKRFIACYLSNTKLYKVISGSMIDLPVLSKADHKSLLSILQPFAAKKIKAKNRTKKPVKIDAEVKAQVESYVEQIVKEGIDITGDNPKWFSIGKALASAFGMAGFDYFNSISQFSPKYNADTIKEDYERFFIDDTKERNGDKVTIKTFFKYCNDAGLYDLKTYSMVKTQNEEKEFELHISKKEPIDEKVHTLCTSFLSVFPLLSTDRKLFYAFKNTHWQRHNDRQVLDHVLDFVNRSTISPEVIKQINTLSFMEKVLRELSLITMVDELTPKTGDLKSGVNVNLHNGILHIDMKTGKRKLLEHDASYMFTGVLPYDYTPDAKCPKFEEWMDAQIPDKSQQVAFYAFVASCLTKHKADIIMMLAGPTSTGKSSLIEITRRLIGMENTVPISASTLFNGGAESAAMAMQMENKLLAYDFDAQPFKALEVLLKVAAQEPIMGWQMGISRRPVTNYGRLILAMNPHNYSVFTPAVARRFITIQMDVVVKKDNDVIPRIYENELSGIFNKVLTIGMKHLIENNGIIEQTEKMVATTLDFHIGSRDSIRWFKSLYEVAKMPNDFTKKKVGSLTEKFRRANPGARIEWLSYSELYRQYRTWCEDVEGISVNKIQIRKHFIQDLELLKLKEFKNAENNSTGFYLIVN